MTTPYSSLTRSAKRSPAGPGPKPGPILEEKPALMSELTKWRSLLASLAAGVSSFWSRFAEIGRKISPTNWEMIKTDVGKALETLSETSLDGLEAALMPQLAWVLESTESSQRVLFRSLDLVQDPNVLSQAALGMSRGYVEDMESRIKVLGLGKRQCGEAFSRVSLMLSGEEGVRTVSALTGGEPTLEAWEPQGDLSTSLYIAVLASRYGEQAEQKLEQIKDTIFGPVPQHIYTGHPLQAMGIVFGPITGVSDASDHEVVDLTLPRSRKSVVYDLAPLIHKSAALEFGPLASIVSGVNFKLAQRLRTIRESPILETKPRHGGEIASADPHPASFVSYSERGAGAEPHPAALRPQVPAVSGPLYHTIDGGLTVRKMLPLGFSDSTAWLPFDGPRPRVEMFGKASETVILSQERAEAAGELLKEFEEKSDSLEETLRAAPELMLREIGKAYESSPTSADVAVAVGLHKAASEIMETQILRPLLALGHRVAYPAAREECAVTRLVQVDSATKELGKKIQEIRLRNAQLDLSRIVSAATQPLKPTLKLYMLTGGSAGY